MPLKDEVEKLGLNIHVLSDEEVEREPTRVFLPSRSLPPEDEEALETNGVSTFREELEQAGIEVVPPEQAGGSTLVWFYGISPSEDEGSRRER